MQTPLKIYHSVCLACIFMAYLVVTAGATVRASGSGMGCPDWPKCFGYLIPPNNHEQVSWGPNKHFARGTMIIHPLTEEGETLDRLLVAKTDLVTGKSFDPSKWTTFDRHDYAIFNPLHTWTEFVNRVLGALIAIPVLLLVGVGGYLARRGLGWKPLIWSLIVTAQLGLVGFLGREVVLGNLTPNSITIHMLTAYALIAFMFVALSLGRERNPWPPGLKPLLALTWLVVVIQIGIGTQVREEVDLLNQTGIGRPDWIEALSSVFTYHKLLSWTVSGLIVWWFIRAWRHQVACKVTIACLALLAIQAISGYLFMLTGFAAVLQPVHLVAAMLLGGLLWWKLIRGPSRQLTSYRMLKE